MVTQHPRRLALAAILISSPLYSNAEETVLDRIRPLAKVNLIAPTVTDAPVVTAPAAAPTPAADPAMVAAALAPIAVNPPDGKKTYNTICFACHATGVSNAPRFGNKADWAPRIAKGVDALFGSALHGLPGTAMQARGTCATCSDDELKAAVEYMVSQAH